MQRFLWGFLFFWIFPVLGTAFGEEPTAASETEWRPTRDPSNFPDNHRPDKYFCLIFFVVLEGLYEDGLVDKQIETLLEKGGHENYLFKNFVLACPICEPTKAAIEFYSKRPIVGALKGGPVVTTFGKGPSKEIQLLLESKKPADHRKALNLLMEKWVTRRLDSMNLSEREKKEWIGGLDKRKQQGMVNLKSFKDPHDQSPEIAEFYGDMEECAVCNGTTCAASKYRTGQETKP